MTDAPLIRCAWSGDDPLYRAYHDDEWGVPVRDEVRLLEMLVLEGAQAGLSWRTILHRREGYRRAFDGFDPEIVATYEAARIEKLLANPGIVRNRAKVESAVGNARAVLRLRADEGSLASFLWRFAGHGPRQNAWPPASALPAATPESRAMSRALVARGFRFVGPTICYAFMQAVGMVNDHTTNCFRHEAVRRLGAAWRLP
ncbi:MAG: DNA-3-methyladenine glycosylase I [Candidatus Latescibacterota bacterium]